MGWDLLQAIESSKALGPHPVLTSKTPLSTYEPGGSKPRAKGVISQSEAQRHSEAFGGDQAIDHVYDCIGLYADAAATAEYHLTKPDGTKLYQTKTKGTPPDAEQGPQELYNLLNKPNPYMLYDELISLLIIDLMLVGNAYWFKWRNGNANQPLALYRLSPKDVKIKPGPYGPLAYEYQPEGAERKLEINPSDIIHFRRPNPHSNYYGLGIIQGAGRSMDLELAITDTQASYFENKADPSMIIQSERRVPIDIFNKLRAQMRARTAGSHNSGEVLLLQAGLKAETLSPNAKEAMFDILSRMSRDRIFAKFRANPMLLGIMDETTGTNKVSDVRREFDEGALRPFLKRLSKQISIALTEAYGVEFHIDHRSMLPADEQIKVAESIAVAPGIKVREVRRQYAQFGIEESTGDEELDNTVLNMPTPEADANGMVTLADGTKVRSDKVGSDRPIGSEPGRPPNGENTRTIGVASTKSLEEVMAALEAKALRQVVRLPDDVWAKDREHDIDEMARAIKDALGDAAINLERELLQHVDGKALKTSDMVGRMRNSAAWKEFKTNIEGSMQSILERAISTGVIHSGLTFDKDIDYSKAAAASLKRSEGIDSIVDTLKTRVLNNVKDARAADAERKDFQSVVRQAINDWSGSQASTIGLTEAVRSYNLGTLEAAALAGISKVYVVDGDDQDEPCAQAHGQLWTIDHARNNLLEHPNCRRAFIPAV